MTAHGPLPRALLAGGVACLHFGVYRLVNEVNLRRPASALLDLSTPLDGLVPYVGWTWVLYYAALPYVMVYGSLAVVRLPRPLAARAAAAYSLAVVSGGSLQLLFPARSPWPEAVVTVQAFHHAVSCDPFVCLPSMHVALVTLTAALAASLARPRLERVAHGALALLVSLSTLTLKEHYVWDVVAGGLLGASAFGYFRRAAGAAPGAPVSERSHP